jgi:hypothetical protein
LPERLFRRQCRDKGKPGHVLIKETPMQKWEITFVDDHGEQIAERFEHDQEPTMEEAARLIRERLLPVPAKLDLNDLEGRTEDPTLKNLKSQHSIEIISIKPFS